MLCSVESGALQHMAVSSIHVVKRTLELWLPLQRWCRTGFEALLVHGPYVRHNNLAYQRGATCGAQTLREVWNRESQRMVLRDRTIQAS